MSPVTLLEPTITRSLAPLAPVPPLRIALLSPYSGTNLGDAAIQQAAIENIRRRCPDALISGITADPDVTAVRHGIPCVPISTRLADGVASYRRAATPRGDRDEPAVRASLWGRVGAAARRVPVLGLVLRGTARVVREGWALGGELVHDVRFARRHDAIVVAGGGQLDEEWGGPWAHPYALFKWALISRAAGTQFVVLSVGVGSLRHPLSRSFVWWALRLASYRSYRDPGSKALLSGMGFTRGDPRTPDLAFSLPQPDSRGGKSAPNPNGEGESRCCVGVSPIGYGHPSYWPTRRPTDHARYLRELTGFVQWLVGRGHEVVLFASGGVDHAIIRDLVARLCADPEGRVTLARVRVARDETLADLLQELGSVDCVVASRLHGVILSHLVGKPTVAVSFDRKVDAHMHDVGMERYCLDLHTVDQAALARAFALLEGEAPAVRAELADARRAMRESLDLQYDAVLQRIAHHRRGE